MRISVPFPRARDRVGTSASGSKPQRWLLLPVVLAILASVVFWWLPSRLAPATTTTTATVSQGSLTLAVSGSGSIAAARSVDLPFQQAGTVTAVDVKVGDQVKAGQALAQIDDADLKLQLQQAQANLKSAEAKLAQVNGSNPSAQDVANAQAALESAKAGLAKTKTSSVTDVQTAQAALVAAQAKLDALKNPSPANISAAQTKLSQAQAQLQSTRDGDSQAKTNAQLALQNSVNALTQAQSKYSTAQQNWQHVQDSGTDPVNPTKTDATGKSKPNTLNDAQRQSYYDAFVQAQAALDSAQNAVTQAQVAYDAARQKETNDIPQAEAAVADAQQQLDALMHPTANDLAQAQSAVTQAQAQLTTLKQGGTAASLASAQAQVTQAQSTLDALTKGGATPDVAAAEATLAQAQASVATAQRNLDNATLKAPFDGVVSAVSVQPGAIVGASTAAVSVVDRSKLHVDINLSETDAARIQVGQPVSLTFDALPNVSLVGKVATVAPAATVQQNVVTYPVQVEFDPGTTPVKVGMSATADIQVQQIDNAILVPSRAVQTSGGARYVTVLQGAQQTPVIVQVQTGASSGGQTEITSCVETGSQCLRPGDVLSIPSAASSSSQQNGNRGGFGAGGFGGGGFGGPVRVPVGGGR